MTDADSGARSTYTVCTNSIVAFRALAAALWIIREPASHPFTRG